MNIQSKYLLTAKALWKPITAGVIAIIITILFYYKFTSHQHSLIKSLLQQKANYIAEDIARDVTQQLLAIRRMAIRWEARGGIPKQEWDVDAKNYIRDQKGLRAIEWADANYHIKWIEPLKGNEAALGFNLNSEKRRADALQKAIKNKDFSVTKPVRLVQGGMGFISYFPLFKEEKSLGAIIGVFDFKGLLNAILPEELGNDFHLHLYDGDNLVYKTKEEAVHAIANAAKIPTAQANVAFYGTSLRLEITPTALFIESQDSILPYIILGAGTLVALLLSMTLYFLGSADHSKERFDLAVSGSNDGIWDWNIIKKNYLFFTTI